MKKLIVAAALATAPFAALSDNGLAQKAATPAKDALKPAHKQASKAVRLSDAELDKVTAGSATVYHDGVQTIVRNDGNANVLKLNTNRRICINCP